MNEDSKKAIVAIVPVGKSVGLSFRNWSGAGRVVLSVYEEGDCYVGTIERVGDRWRVDTESKPAKRERTKLLELCRKANGAEYPLTSAEVEAELEPSDPEYWR